jgi:glycosyltransferase 2 family protein
VLALVLVNLPGFKLDRLPSLVLAANGGLLLAAFAVYYVGFPLRGERWALLLRGTGLRIGMRDATEIIFLSWLVNCLVPAKLGDLYRAWLLKINSPASLSRTFGTVFIERILDLFAISVLGLAAGFWSFRTGLPTEIQVVFGIAVAVVVLLAAALLTLRNFGRRILVRLPVPHRVIEYYDRFEEGVFGAIGLRGLPPLLILTGLIWATEAMRLYLVIQALHLPDVQLGISGAFFVALIGSLLTAVPLSPAGLGIVEAGVVGVLSGAYGIPLTEATTIALVDRAISVLSIIVLGSIAYTVSSKRRGAGLRATGP